MDKDWAEVCGTCYYYRMAVAPGYDYNGWRWYEVFCMKPYPQREGEEAYKIEPGLHDHCPHWTPWHIRPFSWKQRSKSDGSEIGETCG